MSCLNELSKWVYEGNLSDYVKKNIENMCKYDHNYETKVFWP